MAESYLDQRSTRLLLSIYLLPLELVPDVWITSVSSTSCCNFWYNFVLYGRRVVNPQRTTCHWNTLCRIAWGRHWHITINYSYLFWFSLSSRFFSQGALSSLLSVPRQSSSGARPASHQQASCAFIILGSLPQIASYWLNSKWLWADFIISRAAPLSCFSNEHEATTPFIKNACHPSAIRHRTQHPTLSSLEPNGAYLLLLYLHFYQHETPAGVHQTAWELSIQAVISLQHGTCMMYMQTTAYTGSQDNSGSTDKT